MSEQSEGEDLKLYWAVNAELLDGIGFLAYEYIFTNSPQLEFRLLLADAKAGVIDASKVVAFTTDDRLNFIDMITHRGIGYIIDQDTHTLGDIIMGVDHKKNELELTQAVSQSRDVLLNGAGIRTSNVLRRGETDELEPVFSPISIGNKGDLVKNYLQSLDKLFAYYRSFFDPEDIVRYCQARVNRIQAILDKGEGRAGKLTQTEVDRETRHLEGFMAAIKGAN